MARTVEKIENSQVKTKRNYFGLLMCAVVAVNILSGTEVAFCASKAIPTPNASEAQNTNDIPFLDVRFMGADLVDEMVYSWIKNPPFPEKMDLVLAEIVGPVGLDSRFGDMVENRLYELLRDNPELKFNLVHCGICRQLVVKSNRVGTVFSRGIDQAEVFKGLVARFAGRKALSLNFEVEGRDLVLRASIFNFNETQKIVWAERISTSRSSRRLLRRSSPLISLEAAREEQRMILEGTEPIQLTTRFTIRNFSSESVQISQPIVFVEQSFEAILLPSRRHRAALTIGFSSLKNAMEGWSIGGHFSSLMINDRPSLIHPDVYWFMGFHYLRIRGPAAETFASEQLDIDRIINLESEPKASLVAWRLGLETHVKYRYGATVFIENIPQLKTSRIYEQSEFLGQIPYHNWGVGMLVRW